MERLKILVVDDESRMRKLVRDFLVREDYEVLEAGDGEEALDIFYKEKNIALIILDALLRRSGLTAGNDEKFVEAGGIKLDKTAHLVTVDGRPIELSIKEFELLDYFMENQGIALSREKILNNVGNYDYFGDARTIDTHVKKLRAKIGEKGEYIKTIWGVGYKFIVE